jgi:chromosome segregation ATPase
MSIEELRAAVRQAWAEYDEAQWAYYRDEVGQISGAVSAIREKVGPYLGAIESARALVVAAVRREEQQAGEARIAAIDATRDAAVRLVEETEAALASALTRVDELEAELAIARRAEQQAWEGRNAERTRADEAEARVMRAESWAGHYESALKEIIDLPQLRGPYTLMTVNEFGANVRRVARAALASVEGTP